MTDKLQFLKKVSPFGVLPDEVLKGVADLLQEVVHKKESVIYHQETTTMHGIDIIVKGQYETFFYDSGQNKRLVEYVGEAEVYGGVSMLLNRKRSIRTVIAKKGTQTYFLPRQDFIQLCKASDEFFHFFINKYGRQMMNDEYAHFVKKTQNFEENYLVSDQFYSRKLESIEAREIISTPDDTPVFEVARLMGEHKLSCLFVTDKQGKIAGYVTDITLRDNVTARRVDSGEQVGKVMDFPVTTISNHAFVYEAILLMFRSKIRYLLIEDEGQYRGFISRNKLLSEQAQSPFMFIQSVKQAFSIDKLKQKWEKVPEIVFQLLSRGVKSEVVNQLVTAVSDAIILKVVEQVIDEVGTPPAEFVFMALGSEGRKEQTLKTDQDNAIIYEDKANEHREEVRAYFLDFADRVSARLDYIGFSYCTGGFMAKNPKWTHSLSHWKGNYQSWMHQPEPETVMNFSTFFDCRYIYGNRAIIGELKSFLDEELKAPNGLFLYHMANNALQYVPPLTFFKTIRTFNKDRKEVFNIKNTMTPIVDLVRVFALKNRVFATNTGERLVALKDKGIFTEKEFHELMQSYYYLMGMRLKNQASQIINDQLRPDNYIDIKSLTKIEQVTLREIFKTIENFQLKIKLNFTNKLFG